MTAHAPDGVGVPQPFRSAVRTHARADDRETGHLTMHGVGGCVGQGDEVVVSIDGFDLHGWAFINASEPTQAP